MDERMNFYQELMNSLSAKAVTLVAVSKIQPLEKIRELYAIGHRDFGENYVQELVDKAAQLPDDIRWHFIGHLQSNKVRQVIPFSYLIQGVDSFRLLKEIDKQAGKAGRKTDCLLQVFISGEETKFGLDSQELQTILLGEELKTLQHINIRGLMGMASFSDDKEKVEKEFRFLKSLFDTYRDKFTGAPILSMGMSDDYQLAIANGSNMVRIGSLLFGARAKK
ncbi:MAG: YggS family pyridoxal phosphate-dependent enzyme [Chitinophagaceae bacterium]